MAEKKFEELQNVKIEKCPLCGGDASAWIGKNPTYADCVDLGVSCKLCGLVLKERYNLVYTSFFADVQCRVFELVQKWNKRVNKEEEQHK